MNLNDLHPKIKEFLGDLSPDKYKTHTIGSITVYKFISPKLKIFFYSDKDQIFNMFFNINGRVFNETEMIRRINMKIFW